MTREEVIAWLEARVRLEEETGCLLWTMAVNGEGSPIASVDGVRSRAVRPWLCRQLKGEIPQGHRLLPRCKNRRCLNLAHAQAMTISDINRQLAADGHYRSIARRMACRRTLYSDDLVAEARRLRFQEGMTLKAVAAAVGMHFSNVSRICRGESRLPAAPGASVFSLGGNRHG